MKWWLRCIVGNVGTRFWKGQRIVLNKKGISGSAVLILDHLFLSCCFVVPTLPTMQFSHWVTSLEAVRQITCSFLWSRKRLYSSFCLIYSCSPLRPVNTLMELQLKAKGKVRKYFLRSSWSILKKNIFSLCLCGTLVSANISWNLGGKK